MSFFIGNDWRYEHKSYSEQCSLDEVLALLHSHPYGFYQAYPDRVINNIYLDTPDDRFYNDNMIGVAQRIKWRIRWYGDVIKAVHPSLEIKIKSGLYGRKERYALPEFGLERALTDFSSYLAKVDIDPSVAVSLSLLQPTLLNRYCRQYFVSADQQYRVTLDTRMVFADSVLPLRWTDPIEQGWTLELKHDVDQYDADHVFQYLPLRTTKHSKYVIGRRTICHLPPL